MVMTSPVSASFLDARSDSTATGRANCSPRNPSTKRPPRISPRSSRRRNASRISRHFGRLDSRTKRSRNTIPYRFKSIQQVASTARLRSSAVSVYSSAHLPAECLGRAVRPWPCPARRLGSISERRLSKPSAVTIPAATNSHKAVSTSDFSLPVPRTISAKRQAPRCRSQSTTWRAPWLSPIASALSGACRGDIQSASSRTKNVIGATLVGMTRRLPEAESSRVAGCGDSRPHPTAPVRQRWSSHLGS